MSKIARIMEIDERFEFSAVPDERLLTVTLRHVLSGRITALRTLGVLFLVWALLNWVWVDFTTAGISVVLAVLIGAVAPFHLIWSSARALRPVMTGRPADYRIDADGVRVTDAMSEVFYRWPLISAIGELPGVLIVRTGPRFLPLPVAGLPAETIAAIVAMARSRIGTA